MKNVPNSDPSTVATTVHVSPAPMLRAVTPVAIAVRLMLPTNQMAPRCGTLPWRSELGTQSIECNSIPGGWTASAYGSS